MGAGPASYTTVATPVIAMLLSTLFEGYRWDGVAALGVVLVAFGTWLALRPSGEGRAGEEFHSNVIFASTISFFHARGPSRSARPAVPADRK